MVQGGLKKVQGGLEPPLAPHFPRLWKLGYDNKLEIAKAKKPTPKLDILSSKLGCLKRRLMLVRVIALNFRAFPHICLINACMRQQILRRSTISDVK